MGFKIGGESLPLTTKNGRKSLCLSRHLGMFTLSLLAKGKTWLTFAFMNNLSHLNHHFYTHAHACPHTHAPMCAHVFNWCFSSNSCA